MEQLIETIGALIESLKNEQETLKKVGLLGEYILYDLDAMDSNSSKNTNEITRKYRELLSQHPDDIPSISDNTFAAYLSKISDIKGTRIICPGRKQGYYLDREFVQINEELEKKMEVEQKEVESEAIEIMRESHLYPILVDWFLYQEEYTGAKDVSAVRANGKWGNPDILAFKLSEIFGQTELEISTIEVKLFDDNWEKWIFEAVAHTRFANKSYFEFLYPDEWRNKINPDLKLYAEHFGIGIIILEISVDKNIKLKKDKENINKEDVFPYEYFSARMHNPHIKFRKKFLDSLELKERIDIYRFTR